MTPPAPRDARWVIRDITKFLKTYDPPIADLPIDRQAVAHMMWGWWVWLSEQALIVAEAKRPVRVAALVPLVRSVGEHADLMLWLHSVGSSGLQALHAASTRSQQLLWDSYMKENGRGPSGVDRPSDPPAPVSGEEREARRTLDNIEQRMGAFEGGVPYYIYRLVSGLVHAGVNTSRMYAPVDSDGSGRTTHVPATDDVVGLIPSALQDCAVRSCQAAIIFRNELDGLDAELTARVQQWVATLGVDDQLPTPRPAPPQSDTEPSDAEVRNASKQLLEGDYEAAGRMLKELAARPLASDGNPVAIVKSIKKLRVAAKSLLDSATH